MADAALVTFDYESLGELRSHVESMSFSIKDRMRHAADSMIAIGRMLKHARGILGTRFERWIEAEFAFGERTARNYIYVAERFGEYEGRIGSIPPTTLYLLASKSVPDEAIEAVVERAEAGETIDRETAKEIVAEHTDEATADELEETAADEESPSSEPAGDGNMFYVDNDPPAEGEESDDAATVETVSSSPARDINAGPAPLWRDMQNEIAKQSNLFDRHAQDCDEALYVKQAFEHLIEKLGYYVRGVESE